LARPFLRAASHRLRGDSASTALWCTPIRLALPVSVEGCTPPERPPALTPLGRPGPGSGGRLPTARCRSLSGSGSLRSPSPCTAKARQPHRTRPPPEPTLHCVPRPRWFRDSGPGIRISFSCKLTGSTRPAVPVQRLKTIKANQETYAPKSVLIPAPYHARRTVTRFIYIPQGAAADAAAASLLGSVKCMSVGPDFGLLERVPRVPLY